MRIIYGLLILIFCCSCSNKGFNKFYKEEVNNADLALTVPKWLIQASIPEDAKKDIKPFVKGMKKLKLLQYGNTNNKQKFDAFIKDGQYENYLSINDSDFTLGLLTKEDDELIKEIIVEFKNDEDYVLFAILGKMKIEDFQEAIKKAQQSL